MNLAPVRDPLGLPDPDIWDLPDHLSWEECVDETAFPARNDRIPDMEDDR